VAHHRPGFYLRVIEEGVVTPGDGVEQVAVAPERMTVAEIDGLLYLREHPRNRLEPALRIPALSPGWKGSFQALLDQARSGGADTGNAGLAPAAPPPAWPGFRALVVTAVRPESRTMLSLSLAAPDGEPLPAALPGQFVTLRLPADPAGPPLLRSYSLSGPPGAPGYRISVKRETGGAGSAYLHTVVRPGDVLEVAAPRGTFALCAGAGPVLLVSAGAGVTPVLAMLHALAAARSEREIWWLHGARDGGDHPFAVESAELLALLPNAHREVCYSRPDPTDRQGDDYDVAGRLSASVLAELDLPRDADVYLCGPAGFLQDVTAALAARGIEPVRLHTEVFGTLAAVTPGIAAAAARPPHPPTGPPGDGPEVAFARSGLTVRWRADEATLLELAEACDVPTRWSCRTGVCHTCETALLSGAVTYLPDPVDPPGEGTVLHCSARPVGPVTLDL